MKSHLSYVLTAAVGLVAFACGREVSSPSALRDTRPPMSVDVSRVPVIAAPAAPAAPAAAAKPPAEACVEVEPDTLGGKHITLEGELVVDDTYEHPSRGKTRPYILRLDAPRCAIGTEAPSVSELHLASSEDIALRPLVGKRVRVSGDPFPAHTAWHARPVLLMTTSAAALR